MGGGCAKRLETTGLSIVLSYKNTGLIAYKADEIRIADKTWV